MDKENGRNIFIEIMNDHYFDTMNNIGRWEMFRVHKKESVAHHSFLVVFFTRILLEYLLPDDSNLDNIFEKLTIIDYAITHDIIPEGFTGDVHHEVKYNMWNGGLIRKVLDEFVDFELSRKFSKNDRFDGYFRENGMVSKKIEAHTMIVKIADWLSCIFYLSKEIKTGNLPMKEKYEVCINKLHEVCNKFLDKYNNQYNMDAIKLLINTKFDIWQMQ